MATPVYPATLPGPVSWEARPVVGALSSVGLSDRAALELRRISARRVYEASVSWQFLEAEYAAFTEFFRTDLLSGHKWFLMPIPSGAGYVEEAVRFVGRPAARNSGLTAFQVDAQLELWQGAASALAG